MDMCNSKPKLLIEKGGTNIINMCNFTGNIKNYLKKDIINTLRFFNTDAVMNGFIKKYNEKSLKCKLFDILKYTIHNYYYYINNIESIIKLQRYLKLNFINKYNKLKGYANKALCKNDEDFLYMTNKNDIDDIYFFSYKDSLNNVWFFDIRSFIKLVNAGNQNPYTRDSIPEYAINNARIIEKYLIKHKYIEDQQIEVITSVKQQTVDIFSKINQCGYDINIDWFLKLRRNKLKTLYHKLEDIWNYRAQLSIETKKQICPPNGDFCSIPIITVNSINDVQELQSLILNELLKIDNAVQISDKIIGYTYFIMSLSEVCIDCYNNYYWLIYGTTN